MINHNKNIAYIYLPTRHFTRLDPCKVLDQFVEVNLSENVIFNTHQGQMTEPIMTHCSMESALNEFQFTK